MNLWYIYIKESFSKIFFLIFLIILTSYAKENCLAPKTDKILHYDLSLFSEPIAAKYNGIFRIIDNPETILTRYYKRKYESTKGNHKTKTNGAIRGIKFYNLLMGPSWDAYQDKNKTNITLTIHLGLKIFYKRLPRKYLFSFTKSA